MNWAEKTDALVKKIDSKITRPVILYFISILIFGDTDFHRLTQIKNKLFFPPMVGPVSSILSQKVMKKIPKIRVHPCPILKN